MSRERDMACVINDRAEEFTLSHAVMALRAILDDNNRHNLQIALTKAKADLISGHLPITDEEYEAKRKILFEHKRAFIVVDYLDKVLPEGARTYAGNGYIEIVLPSSLKGDMPKLRKLVGHELGHIALHLDDLISDVCRVDGTRAIRDPKKEKEADDFADELIRLRDEHLRKRFAGSKNG
jgi:hypothetical protein